MAYIYTIRLSAALALLAVLLTSCVHPSARESSVPVPSMTVPPQQLPNFPDVIVRISGRGWSRDFQPMQAADSWMCCGTSAEGRVCWRFITGGNILGAPDDCYLVSFEVRNEQKYYRAVGFQGSAEVRTDGTLRFEIFPPEATKAAEPGATDNLDGA